MTQAEPAVAPAVPRFAEFVGMIAALMALTALSIDVMLPALPHIRDQFDLTDPNRQQLVITAYVVGFAIGQLFYGPLSDWLGRKTVLMPGLAIYAAASYACFAAPSFEALLIARLFQGLANAAPRVVAVAIVRDVYGGRRMAEVMSFVMMVFIVVPVLAPSVGGLFLVFGSWHAIFAFLFVISLAFAVWMAIRLPETRPEAMREPLSVAWLVRSFGEAVRNRQTLGYTLAIGVIFGSLMGYINSAEQIFVEVYDLGRLFPVAFGACAAALAVASFLNSRLVGQLGMRRISHGAMLGFAALSILHLAIALGFGRPPLLVFVVLLALTLLCFGLMMPNFNALAMEPMGRIAGTASSFVGAVTTGVGAVLGLWVGQTYDGSVVPLLTGFAIFGTVGALIVLFTERGRLFAVGTF
jgi:DHA1 family bicyclomycin/chloramphenicol resistance-like MFS transporter